MASLEILSSRFLLRPRDFDASVRFYRDVVGLHVYREFAGGRGVVLFLGGGFLELAGTGTETATTATQLWLQVRSVDAVHEQLRDAGVPIDEPPTDKPWGLRELRVRDPDEVRLVFVEIPADHPLRRDTR